MSQYRIYPPLAITATNFAGFQKLLIRQSEGAADLPAAIAAYYEAHQADLLQEIKGPQLLVYPSAERDSDYSQVMMWGPQDADKPDFTRSALLFLDVTKTGDRFDPQPRQWILGPNAQVLIPYKMSCCTGLSAIAAFKHAGALTPALLENAAFTRPEHRDIFNLAANNGSGGVMVDPAGDTLKHWHAHLVREAGHSCQHHAAIHTPARLRAFGG